MNLKKLIYILLSLLYLDLIFNLFSYNSYLFSSVINIIFFDLVLGILIHIITSLFSEKVNKIITYIIFVFLWFWYSLYYVFYKVLITPFSISLFRQTDQVLKFGKNVIISIIQNIHVLLLFFFPVIIIIILRNKIRFNKAKIKNILIYIVVFLMTIGIYVGNIFVQGRGVGSAYNLYYETRNTSLNIQRLGVMSATYLDIKRALFGFNEKIEVVKQEIIEDEVNVEYEYNKQDFDFDGGSGNIQIINKFMDSEIGTKQNKYTGKYIIQSFDYRCLLYLKNNYPNIIRGLLISKNNNKIFNYICNIIYIKMCKINFISISKKLINNKKYLKYINKYPTYIWTINSIEELDKYMNKCTGYICNNLPYNK